MAQGAEEDGQGRIMIGTSGWSYAHWAGPFYPPGLPSQERLTFYARRFPTVEIDSTFYRLPSRDSLGSWRDAAPPGFVFAMKASRYVTHMKKLREPARSTRRLLAAADALWPRMGPILFQLPPRWRCDPERLERFLDALPTRFRYAFELRDPSWETEAVRRILARRGAARVVFDLAGRRSPAFADADFCYVRLHGPDGRYRGAYDAPALARWARLIARWRKGGRDVYCYFDNDAEAQAPLDATRLQVMLGLARLD